MISTGLYRATRQLHRRHALFAGPSGGAAYLAARWWAAANPDALTVVMLPDEGYRYQDTVYDDAWLQATGHLERTVPDEPVPVDDPRFPQGLWACYDWQRRSYAEVLGGDRSLSGDG